MDCLEKLVKCIGKFNKGEIDADTSCQIEKQILTDEIDDPELLNFAIENISELFGYLATERVNIKIHRDITGEMWFGVGRYENKDVSTCFKKSGVRIVLTLTPFSLLYLNAVIARSFLLYLILPGHTSQVCP